MDAEGRPVNGGLRQALVRRGATGGNNHGQDGALRTGSGRKGRATGVATGGSQEAVPAARRDCDRSIVLSVDDAFI